MGKMKPKKIADKLEKMSRGGTQQRTNWIEIREVIQAAKLMAEALDEIEFDKDGLIRSYNEPAIWEAKIAWGLKLRGAKFE